MTSIMNTGLERWPVFLEVEGVAGERCQQDHQEDQNRQNLKHLGLQVVTVGDEEVPPTEKSKQLDVALHDHFQDDPPEGVGPEESTDLVVEQTVEQPVEDHHD